MEEIVKITIVLEDGDEMNFDLYPQAAPVTVKNFTELANKKFFDGLCFHRVIDGFMIQGGGMLHTPHGLMPKEGAKTIRGEFASNGFDNPIKHTAGTISMARTQVKDSASSQFFICVADTPFLDGEYAAFGKVSDQKSLDKAIAVGKVRTGNMGYYGDVPLSPVVIRSIRVVKD
ncbi:MAG: peptidylprolyl isomerase [Clostridia bacterium]|nr:peptidylprolyl isomerase [Clostridia bacterium]